VEFSVLYLIKALLKKWYVILLVMAVTAAAAVGLSKLSYNRAVADYQQNMAILQSENKKVLLTTDYSYRLDDASLSFLGDYVKESSGAYSDKEQLLFVAKNTFNEKLAAVLEDKEVLGEVATKYEISEEELAEFLEITRVDKDVFRVSVSELSEEQAKEMRDCYLTALKNKVDNAFISYQFEESPAQVTVTDEAARFISAVMEEPTPPSLIRTVATAALYAFALGCVGVLVYIFIKESKKEKKEEKKDCEQQ